MIYTFASLPTAAHRQVGKKASILAQLYQAGYPIPNGFIIASTAFHQGQLCHDTWDLVRAQAALLRQGNGRFPFAVRSSALSEDTAHTSFAGGFESVLNVVGDDALQQAICHVHQSQYHERVAAYAQAHAMPVQQEVAVIVQEMVPADMAGVLFTADPITGSDACMIGNFVYGLGERLVSGEVDGETFTLKRPSGQYSGPSILKRHAHQLYKLADRLTAELGGAQDIEWAIAHDTVYVLQSRPVTTLPENNQIHNSWNASLYHDNLWISSNVGEALPDVMTPFTWSLIQIYLRMTFPLTLPDNQSVMGNIGGRLYFNLSIMVAMMQALGFNQARMDYEAEEFFGHLPAGITVPTASLSRWDILRQMLPYMATVPWRRRRLLSESDTFTAEMPAHVERIRQRVAATTTPADLAQVWQIELGPLVQRTCQMLQVCTSRYENAYRPLRYKLREQVGGAEAITLLSSVSQDQDMLSSLRPLIGLWQVAQGKMNRESYIREYGHRSEHELEVSQPQPAEDPAWLEQRMALLADMDVPGLLAAQQAKQARAWADYARQYPRMAPKLKAKLEKTAVYARGREAVRSEMIRLFGAVRTFALRAGELTGLGDGVFYLAVDELAAVLAGEMAPAALIPDRRQVHQRYQELPSYPPVINGRFDPFVWAADPNRRTDIFDAHLPQNAVETDINNLIKGLPGSPGIVEGVVRRLDKPDQGMQLQPGEVLVTQTTNIGWTPLFPRAAAIITDVGAPLSHAAIVARELGRPAVVGCGSATMHLKTGDYVRVNGNQGIVEMISQLK